VLISSALFLPSEVMDLRWQESLFPLIAITVIVAVLIIQTATVPLGLLILSLVGLSLYNFTGDVYVFFRDMTIYASLYLIIVLSYYRFKDIKDMLYNTLCIISLFNVALIICQINKLFYILNPVFPGAVLRTGLFANENETSIFFAMTTFCFFRKGWWWLAPVALGGLFLTHTANGMLALIGALSIWAVSKYSWKKTIPVIVALLITFSVVASQYKSESIESRFRAYSRAVILIQDKPLMGWGIGQAQYIMPMFFNPTMFRVDDLKNIFSRVIYKEELAKVFSKNHPKDLKYFGSIWMQLHNDYLELWLECGVFVLLLALASIIIHGIIFFKTKEKDWIPFLGAAAAFISANAFFTFHIGRLLFLTVIFCALVMGQYNREGRADHWITDFWCWMKRIGKTQLLNKETG
jgi:hypothetical protein